VTFLFVLFVRVKKKTKKTFAKTTRFVLPQITPVADSRAADSPIARTRR
jgi:hypothetical protein